MFWCCSDNKPRESYQIIRKNSHNESTVSYVTDIKALDHGITNDDKVKIRRVRMSDYNELVQQCKRQNTRFEDISFPPNDSSLGNIPGVKATWKRISQFLSNPTLFDDKIEPNDVVSNNAGDCYLLSAIAALAQDPEIIKVIFHGQEYNKEGIYRVFLSLDGVIQEVVVDDFIPLNNAGAPLFCQPTVRETTSQFWTLILEKALAKIKGSYANIMQGTPSEIFRAVTYCPAESMVFDEREQDKIWNLMVNCSGYNDPFCATTKDSLSKYSGLIPEHTYTIVAVANLSVRDMTIGDLSSQSKEKLVKLRNPWAKEKQQGWKGRAGNQDRDFWQSVQKDQQLQFLKRPTICGDYGIFYISFTDFCKNFNQIHYCNFHHNGKTASESFYPQINPQGSYFDVNINEPGVYTVELIHSDISKQSKEQKGQEGGCRSSFLLLQNKMGKLTYRGGVMKPNQENIMLTLQLQPGNYVVFAQIQPTRITKLFPDSSSVSVHSSFLATITPADSKKYLTALHDAFLADGLQKEKKMIENNGLMTISYRLLFQQGGFGYIVFHNESTSDKAFVVNYEEQQFSNAHLQVVEPARHDKNFEIRVNPGNDMLILARAKNEKVESWKFPPKMNVRLEPLF